MMEPAENRSRHDAVLRWKSMPENRRRRQPGRRLGEARPETRMRAAAVVVSRPLSQNPSEVRLSQQNQEVQTLPA